MVKLFLLMPWTETMTPESFIQNIIALWRFGVANFTDIVKMVITLIKELLKHIKSEKNNK